jgi:hypothetical protein
MKALREGIHIPAMAVRITLGTLAAAAVAAAAFNAPDMWRYFKIETM